jgi:hypothetical protein
LNLSGSTFYSKSFGVAASHSAGFELRCLRRALRRTNEPAADKPAAEKPNGNPPAANPTDGAQREAAPDPRAVADSSPAEPSDKERAAFDAASPRTQRIAARLRRELRSPAPQAPHEEEPAVAPFTTTRLQGRALSVGFGNRKADHEKKKPDPTEAVVGA